MSNVEIVEKVETVEVKEETRVEVVGGMMGLPGPAGPQGDPGPAGASGGSFHFETAVTMNPWVIAHNLGYYPSLARCRDDAGTYREPTVVHIDTDNLELHFIGPTAGEADLS